MIKMATLLLFLGLLAACSTNSEPKHASAERLAIEEDVADKNALAKQEEEFKAEGYDSGPQIISVDPPVLTQRQINAGVNGIVVAQFTIGVDGKVSDVTLLEACSPELGEVVRRTVLQWRFKPAMKHGEPVPVSGSRTFVFRFK